MKLGGEKNVVKNLKRRSSIVDIGPYFSLLEDKSKYNTNMSIPFEKLEVYRLS